MLNLTCTAALALASSAIAQCGWQLQPTGQGIPGVDLAVVDCTTWDADGAGPLPPLLVLAGDFNFAGDRPAQRIAAFDPANGQWSSLGALDAYPRALAVLPSGQLLVGGWFAAATQPLLQWNGTAWVPFAGSATTLPGEVRALKVAANGELLAIVSQPSGGGAISSLYRLVAGAWQNLGTATGASTYLEILAVTELTNGTVVVGGFFGGINGVSAPGVAAWNGTAWSGFGNGTFGYVLALAELANGDLVVGGDFSAIGSIAAANVAHWNGTGWSPLGSGTAAGASGLATVEVLLRRANGDLVAGGNFEVAGGATAYKVAAWNGASWSAIGAGIEADPPPPIPTAWPVVRALHEAPNGDLFAGGYFQSAGGSDAPGIARWDGTSWGPLRAEGIGNTTSGFVYDATGDLIAFGAFRDIDGMPMGGLARWDGAGWHSFGTGLGQVNPAEPSVVHDAVVLANGQLAVGGDFAMAGGVAAHGVALWNGSAWQALGAGVAGPLAGPRATVRSVAQAANGDLVVAGDFQTAGGVPVGNVARWNGTAWAPVGSLSSLPVGAIACLPNGDLVALQDTSQVTVVWRFDGTSWQSLGNAAGTGFFAGHANALLPLPNGDFLVGGDFTQIGFQPIAGVARRSGGSWSPLGSGLDGRVAGFARLPNGDLVVGGSASLVPAGPAMLLRWDGSAWSVLQPLYCGRIAASPRGEIACSTGVSVGGVASAYLARVTPTCHATAVASGTGCSGSGGANVLSATSWPWLGTTFSAVATGMPANGVAVVILGLATATTPLAAILPQGAPGCDLLVAPDLLLAQALAGPTLTTSLAIPGSSALVGRVLHEQVAPLELSPLGDILSVTASNRLSLTIGSL